MDESTDNTEPSTQQPAQGTRPPPPKPQQVAARPVVDNSETKPPQPDKPAQETRGRARVPVARTPSLMDGHNARAARAVANWQKWLPLARWSFGVAETFVRAHVMRRNFTGDQDHDREVARLVNEFPRLADIPVRFGVRTTTALELESECLATLAAYAIPFNPDDPLFAVLFKHAAVSQAVDAALTEHLRKNGVIK